MSIHVQIDRDFFNLLASRLFKNKIQTALVEIGKIIFFKEKRIEGKSMLTGRRLC